MSTGHAFAVEAAGRVSTLRRQIAALEAIARVVQLAESDAATRTARSRGGVMLDPADPTMATLPAEWLHELLRTAYKMGETGDDQL